METFSCEAILSDRFYLTSEKGPAMEANSFLLLGPFSDGLCAQGSKQEVLISLLLNMGQNPVFVVRINFAFLAIRNAPDEDSDQTVRMHMSEGIFTDVAVNIQELTEWILLFVDFIDVCITPMNHSQTE